MSSFSLVGPIPIGNKIIIKSIKPKIEITSIKERVLTKTSLFI
jgi:hypothetical protein